LHIPYGRIYVSRNVQFIEHEFPFVKSSRDIQGINSNNELQAPLLILPFKANETEQGASTVGIQIPAPSNSNSGPTTASIPQPTNPAQSQLDTAPDPTHNLNAADPPPIIYKRRNQHMPLVHRLDPNPLSNGTTILNLSSLPSIHPASQEF
jgi:hypothetical protein